MKNRNGKVVQMMVLLMAVLMGVPSLSYGQRTRINSSRLERQVARGARLDRKVANAARANINQLNHDLARTESVDAARANINQLNHDLARTESVDEAERLAFTIFEEVGIQDSTVMILAVKGCLNIIRYLVEWKHIPIRLVRSALLAAIRGHQENVSGYLVEHAHVEMQDHFAEKVFVTAAKYSDLDVLKYVASRGTIQRETEGEAFLVAVSDGNLKSDGNIKVVDYFINERKMDVKSHPYGIAALTRTRNPLVVDALLAAGVDVSGQRGTEALIKAVANDSMEIVDALIAAGVDVNGQMKEDKEFKLGVTAFKGDTALIVAARSEDKNRMQIVNALIAAGANANMANARGETPLMFAAQNGAEDIMDVLIKKGADINAKAADNNTVMICAAKGCSANKMKELIAAGGNIHEETEDGFTALLAAIKAKNADMVDALISANTDVYPDYMYYAAVFGNEQTIDSLVRAGIKVDSYEEGITPLMFAAAAGNVDTIEALIKHGANVNARRRSKATQDENGRVLGLGATPLMFAAANGYADAVAALIEAGAKVDARLQEKVGGLCKGVTALMITEDMDVVEVLVEQGHANVKAKDDEGYTVFDYEFDNPSKEQKRFLRRREEYLTDYLYNR